ncbi:MAG: hypothetical protein HKN23_06995 [Verrucomicrobiales bacterium]|nr:hypothetical protein [Verrucomicrobiales bacterium]
MVPHVTFKESVKKGCRIEIDSIDPEVVATVLKRMIKDDLPVTEFHREERKLEDAFIEILGEIEEAGGTTVK